jgi:hypothetical protein
MPDAQVIRSAQKRIQDKPDEGFRIELFHRATTLLRQRDIPKAAIAFEMLHSTFAAFEGGLQHQDISAGYPNKAWREDTVEIPRAWVKELVNGWRKYKEASTGTTVGEAFGLEGGGQGKGPTIRKLAKMNKDIKLSNLVLVEYLYERDQQGRGSWERAIEAVAEHQKISFDTVERAFEKFGKESRQRLEQSGLIVKGGKTS